MQTNEYMTVGEARTELGINKVRMAKYVKDGVLPAFRSEQNKRVKWVRRADVAALKGRLAEMHPDTSHPKQAAA